MNLRQLLSIKAASPKGEWSEEAYSHTGVKKLKFIGNNYSFTSARYANKPNYIKGYARTFTIGTEYVSVAAYDNNVAVLNGTHTSSGTDTPLWDLEVDIPAGTYVFKVEPFDGKEKLTNVKNIHLDLWYDGNETSTRDLRVTLYSVKSSVVSSSFTAANHVYKVRVWIGVNTNEYDNYMMYYSVFPSDTQFEYTGVPVPANGSTVITLGSEAAFVETMQHKSQSK